jgi:hypothetical protein
MAGMSRIAVLKQFFSLNASRPVENSEMMVFWKALGEEERQEFAVSAATQLGVELAEVAKA